MIHCYDYNSKQNILFRNTKEASKELKISIRSVQRSICDCRLVANRFIFDLEEISNLEIKHKEPLPYFVFDLVKKEIIELTSLVDIRDYMLINHDIKVDTSVLSKGIERKNICYKTILISRSNDFSFILKHRNIKSISRIYNINFLNLSYE